MYSDAAGRVIVLPCAAMRTEVLTYRVLISEAGQPIVIAPEPEASQKAEATSEQTALATPEPAAG